MAAVVYDGDVAVYTPLHLWTSTGVCPIVGRAVWIDNN
jgi:hypothetical protein